MPRALKFLIWWLAAMAVATLFSRRSLSYPETIRYGYNACASCHVAPAGGNTLNGYGRLTADHMTTWGYEGEARGDYGLFGETPLDPYFDRGGDLRYAWLKYEDESGTRYVNFPMQADVELAAHLSKQITLVGSVGRYSRERAREYRRHYLLFRPVKEFSVRIGRFTPAFGLLLPDHTAVTRQNIGFGQGSERYSTEVAYVGKRFELFLTGSMGSTISASGDSEKAVHLESINGERSTILRGSYFAAKNFNLGTSYYFGRNGETLNRFGGIHTAFGVGGTGYGLAEIIYKPSEYAKTVGEKLLYRQTLGWEYYRGAHARINSEWSGILAQHALELMWMPRPHWEINAQLQNKRGSRRWLLVAHYYL